MLKINRLRIEIYTRNGLYGFDNLFKDGLNFVASNDNTCGKSSILAAIYYCLGCEEILGGQGAKTLTSVFKSEIEDDYGINVVLQSGAYLEITNGLETITIYRSIVNEKREDKLVTVFFTNISQIKDVGVNRKDYYVLSRNSATNDSGFHKFLNQFLSLSLPTVYDTADNERKLYIQQVLAAFFIEQKKGWSDLLSRAPYFGVPNYKKHIIEYLINLHKNENDHQKRILEKRVYEIEIKWSFLIKEIHDKLSVENCSVMGLTAKPELMSDKEIDNLKIVFDSKLEITDYISKLNNEYLQISALIPKNVDNFDELCEQLKKIEDEIISLRLCCDEYILQRQLIEKNIRTQEHNLDLINTDIINNKDAKKLKELGSNLGCSFANDTCPLCGQTIKDTLLQNEGVVMSIEDNISHLESQKKMLLYSIDAYKNKLNSINNVINRNNGILKELDALAKSIKNDIYSVDEAYSESIVLKKLKLAEKIESLKQIQTFFDTKNSEVKKLCNDWCKTLDEKKLLSSNHLSDEDNERLKYLKQKFINYLYCFNYSSMTERYKIRISEDTYLPLIDEFDMKYDSSASDIIRMIWAYTLALLETSNKYCSNPINILIFDEPKQQSIINSDLSRFFDEIINVCNNDKSQVIIGITAKKGDSLEVINGLDKNKYNLISLTGKAFRKL